MDADRARPTLDIREGGRWQIVAFQRPAGSSDAAEAPRQAFDLGYRVDVQNG